MAKGIGAVAGGIGKLNKATIGGVKKVATTTNKAIPGGWQGGLKRVVTGDETAGMEKKTEKAKPTLKTRQKITATGGQDLGTAGMGGKLPESIMAKPNLPPPPGAPPAEAGGVRGKFKALVKSAGKSQPKELTPPPKPGQFEIDKYDPNWRTFGSKGK